MLSLSRLKLSASTELHEPRRNLQVEVTTLSKFKYLSHICFVKVEFFKINF